MASKSRYVWVEHGLKDSSESQVPFVNAGLHYGFSVFEGIRCYATDTGAAIFRLEEHVDRLLDSAHVIGFRDLPCTREQILEAINQTVAANGFPACYIRPMIFLDGGMSMVIDAGKPRLIVAVWEWTTFFSAD